MGTAKHDQETGGQYEDPFICTCTLNLAGVPLSLTPQKSQQTSSPFGLQKLPNSKSALLAGATPTENSNEPDWSGLDDNIKVPACGVDSQWPFHLRFPLGIRAAPQVHSGAKCLVLLYDHRCDQRHSQVGHPSRRLLEGSIQPRPGGVCPPGLFCSSRPPPPLCWLLLCLPY